MFFSFPECMIAPDCAGAVEQGICVNSVCKDVRAILLASQASSKGTVSCDFVDPGPKYCDTVPLLIKFKVGFPQL